MLTDPILVKCLVGITAALFALLAAVVVAPSVTEFMRKCRAIHGLLVLAVVCILFGGTKPVAPLFTYDGGLKGNDARPSYATNDMVFVAWQLDPCSVVIPPESAPVYIDYRPIAETNAEWGCLGQSTVGAWEWTGELTGATNFNFNIYAYYIPPEPVHTNVVWEYCTIKDPERRKYIIPLRATIHGDDRIIYPPTPSTEE